MGEREAQEAADRGAARLGRRLVAATLGYDVVEAGVGLAAGLAAGSIALLGFGLDSVIEIAAAGLLLWRLSQEMRGVAGEALEATEQRIRRFVGGSLLLLAVYVAVEAGRTLWMGSGPGESLPGIVLAAASLVVMPSLAWGKLRVAQRISSRALAAEAKETLACSYLSFALLVGLVANAAVGWWWADPAAALAMVPWLVREGAEGVRAETCEEEGGSG